MKRAARRAMMIVALAAGGCGLQSPPQPLLPSQFVRSGPAVAPDGLAKPVDQSGALVYGELHAPLLPDQPRNPNPHAPATVSPLVRQAIPGPEQIEGISIAATAPATLPATQPGLATGGYQVEGFVLATVNGNPIYAHKVLAAKEHELSVEARQLDPERFRQAAAQAIFDKLQELEKDQLEVAAANTYLSQEDKTSAELYAVWWRQRQITLAGGSVEVAKQRALESGVPFEDQVKEQHDRELVRLYYQRREVPKIHVGPADMRRYYQEHLDSEFTSHAKAKFRLIRIDVARSGGVEQAVRKSDEILRQLKGGAEFAELAARYNDDPSLMKNGGDVGWVNKGEFANEDIEKAVWALHPGEFTLTPVKVTSGSGTAFYLAMLEARKPGAVQPFDSSDVQQRIQDTLFGEQLRALRAKDVSDLLRKAVILPTSGALETAVEMAMQRYPAWAAVR